MKLNLMGYQYQIEYHSEPIGGAFGDHDQLAQKIRIYQSGDVFQEFQTLWHEALHMGDDNLHLFTGRDAHKRLDRTGLFVATVLRDNRILRWK